MDPADECFVPICFYSPAAAQGPLHRSSGSFPLKRRFAKPDSKEAIRCWYPSTLWACVLALRATQMSHCFMAVDAIEF